MWAALKVLLTRSNLELKKLLLWLLPEHFAQQRRCLSHGILADLLFFLRHHVEEAVHRLSDDVLVEVEALLIGDARSHWIAHELVVLPHDSNILHGLVNNGSKGFSQLVGALAFEVFGCGGVAAG